MGFTFDFEADQSQADPVWVRMRVWQDYHTIPLVSEVFELGEPVRLSMTLGHRPITHIYWISSFETGYREIDERVRLRICPPGSGLNECVDAPPSCIRKLPDMLRIAVEADRPPTEESSSEHR
jgi:hypothetical protein